MPYPTYKRFLYTLTPAHGFGIIILNQSDANQNPCFLEDGTLENVKQPDDTTDSAVCDLLEEYLYRDYRFKPQASNRAKDMLAKGTCTFAPDKDGSLLSTISFGGKEFRVTTSMKMYRFDSECSCGKSRCEHVCAASAFLLARIRKLKHDYIRSDLPLDKSLFLEPDLENAIMNHEEVIPDANLIRSIRDIICMVDAARSDDYYWLVHRNILNVNPFEYDAHFLEDCYGFLLTALFEDDGYSRAVLDSGTYADPEKYEERQQRSNRASFKRVLKQYRTCIRDLSRDNFREDLIKEFILKYRNNLPDLLRYYAEGKEELEQCDLTYLAEISSLPDLNPEHLKAAAAKLDAIIGKKGVRDVFRQLTERIPSEEIADFYSGLQNITMPMEEIKRLPIEDQRKMINNIPISRANFRYVMEQVLCDFDDRAKGLYILQTCKRIGFTRDNRLIEALLEEAARLPDSRLLVNYVKFTLCSREDITAPHGNAENELSAYFDCRFEVVNAGGSYYTDFNIQDPANGITILSAREENEKLSARDAYMPCRDYSPEQIRDACLKGREEEYRRACDESQDAVDAFLFEKKYKQFAAGYRKLCSSFDDGKLLITSADKVGIDWLVYREDGSNALAFKVGSSRKYVIKDAPSFLQAFKTGQTVKYGKDLVLTHEPDSLDEPDASAVRLLMSARFTKGRKSDKNNKRYITINDSLLASVLDLHSGRTISYNDTPCLLRFEGRKVRLTVSARYELSTDINPSSQEYLNLLGKGYLLEKQKDGSLIMDRVDATVDENNLIDLVYSNPPVRIKPILKDFQKNIYSRFFEMIDVDERIRPAFANSRLRLCTYFDFVRSTVTARVAAYRDGAEIPAESLTDRIDQVKLELLQTYLASLGFVDGVLADEGKVLAFFKLDFKRMKSLTNVYLSESLQKIELKSVGRPVIRVTYKNDLVSVFLEKSEYDESELEQIIAGLRKKKKYIMLSGDRIIDLDSEAAKDLGDAVQDFGMNPKDLYKKKTISFITAIKAFSHQRSCRVDKYLRDMIEEIRSFKEAAFTPPVLNGTLREYQEDGFRWMSVLSKYGMGGILADDMGLGKTIQVIALIKSDGTQKPSLVVCPKSLVLNWISEFAKFDGTTPVTAVYGPESRRSELISAIDYGKKAVYITSYDSLRNDIGKYGGQFNYGILDEAQYIKNVHAQKTKSVKELKVLHRFALTGTPIENSVIDLWSIFDYTMPGYFEELGRFRDTDTEVIARKSAPFILRRVKEDVLEDLPPKYERILSADMSSEQRRVYESMRMEARRALEQGGRAFDVLPYLTRLRQVCVDPGMFLEGYEGGSGKMEMLASLIPEYLGQGHRILIFSQFVKALEAVEAMLGRMSIPAYFLSGSTSARDRMEMMDSFNNGSGTDVFLISLKAGGTGLNLTGADTVIHLDPWWNVAAENQASDRTHRIGQTRNVEVIKLIAEGSIEQRVVELQDIKREVIRQVISDDDGSVTSARLEDIAFVLG